MLKRFARYSNIYTFVALIAMLVIVWTLGAYGILSKDTALSITITGLVVFMFFAFFVLGSRHFIRFKRRVQEEYGDIQPGSR